jgi:E3 ubiquitin-protein ligase BRE1
MKPSRKRKLPSPEAPEKRFCCDNVDPRCIDPDILLHQAPYMKVRLKEYRRKAESFESQIEDLERNRRNYNNLVHVIKHHWTTLIDNLQVLLMRVDVSASLPTPSKQQTATSLLQQLVNHQTFSSIKVDFLNDNDFVEKQLEEKTKASISIMLKIVQSLEAQRNNSEEISAMLRFDRDPDSVQTALSEENERLTAALKHSEESLDAMQIRFKETQEEKEKISDDLLLLKEQAQKWKKERDEMNSKYQASLRKIDMLMLLPPPSVPTKKPKVELSTSVSELPCCSSDTPAANGPDPLSDGLEIHQLKIELEETRLIAESRLTEIKSLGDKNNRLVKSSDALKQSIETMSTDLILTNPKYIEAKQTADFYQKGYTEYYNLSERFRVENGALRREIEEHRVSFEERINTKVEEFLKIQKEKDMKLFQMKKERDSLAFQLEEKMEQPSPGDLIKELRLLTNSQASHLKRLRAKVDKNSPNDHSTLQVVDPALPKSANELETRVNELETVVSEMEKKEKRWVVKKEEMQVLIDTYKTASKESRELFEIRSNERRLQEANEELTKRVKQLEEDLAAFKQFDVDIRGPNPVASHMQAQKEALEGELKKLEKTIRDITKAKEILEEEGKSLLSEIDEISKAFEEIQEQNDRLLQQIEEKHDTSSSLVKEKLRGRKVQQRMAEENAILQEKTARLNEKAEMQTILIRTTEGKLKMLQDLTFRLQEELRLSQSTLEAQRKISREDTLKIQDLQERLQTSQTTIDDVRKDATSYKLKVEDQEQLCVRISEEKESLQRKFDRVSKSLSLSKSASTSELFEEEIKELRRQLQCDVCKDRRKSCIVSKCWHIFCRECIENSLSARRRICPACGRAISRSEVHDIFL